MSTGVITSFTLIDFPSESEMTAFFVFFENNIESLADELRAIGWNTKIQNPTRHVTVFGQNS